MRPRSRRVAAFIAPALVVLVAADAPAAPKPGKPTPAKPTPAPKPAPAPAPKPTPAPKPAPAPKPTPTATPPKPGNPTPGPKAPTKPAPKPAKPAPKPAPPPRPLAPLALLPSIARVKVTSHGSAIAVVEEVSLPRGEWRGEPLRFHVAFGAPGPRAIDAHLVAVGDGELEPPDDDAGEVLHVERVPRRPVDAHPLLGRDSMAGVVVTIPPASLERALERGDMASLRIRSLVDVSDVDASGASSVVVRLGESRGTPLTLGRIVVGAAPSAPRLTGVEARLCGPDADPHPLAVGHAPRLPDGEPVIAPVLAVRHAGDDLCVRLWHGAGAP